MDRFTQREKIIRISGVLMFVAPFFNFFISLGLCPAFTNPWTMHSLTLFAQNVSVVSWGLYVLSLIVGGMMMRGRRDSWAFVLLVLAFYIMWNCFHFSQEKKSGLFQPLSQLAINCGLFVLVYMQEFHQLLHGRPPPKAKKNVVYLAAKQVRVNLEGVGPWASIVGVSESEMRMRCLLPDIPEGIEWRVVEMTLANGSRIRARFASANRGECIFTYLVPPKAADIELFGKWLERPAA